MKCGFRRRHFTAATSRRDWDQCLTSRALWKFDGQTTNDSSGNGNHGTLQNGATYSTDVPSTGGSQRPVPVAGGPYTGQLAQSVNFSSSGSFDPDGTISSYHWNFGDGTSANTRESFSYLSNFRLLYRNLNGDG